MAGKKSKDSNEKPVEGEESDRDFAAEVMGDDSPEGFRRVNPIDGARLYFKATEGATLRGVLLGRFRRHDSEEGEDKWYYQVRCTAECPHTTDGEGEAHPAQIGSIVHLDERSGLRDLEAISREVKPQEVFIRSVEKVKLKKSAGNFWRWDVFARVASAGTLAKLAEAAKNDATPF